MKGVIEMKKTERKISTKKEAERDMKESGYKSYDELPLFLNAETVAKPLACHRPAGMS